jgi:hypothetical protein
MGDAKRRGSLDERIAQVRAERVPPKPGLYLSTKEVKGMRFIVEDVAVADADDDDGAGAGFFLVSMIDEASADDMGAMGNELDPDQWFELVEQYGLVRSET